MTVAVVCASFLVAGCAESEPPLEPAARAKPAMQAAVAPAVVTAPTPELAPPPPQAEEFTYNPSGRRDPFRSLIVTGGKRNVDLLPPLQRREASELKFVAVVWGELGTYGMLEMPDGKGYVVRIGTRVGPNRGVVKRITAKDLTVVERYADFFGETRTRDIVLDLRTREEGLE
jgi:type IV pilus assembly protein PilP